MGEVVEEEDTDVEVVGVMDATVTVVMDATVVVVAGIEVVVVEEIETKEGVEVQPCYAPNRLTPRRCR